MISLIALVFLVILLAKYAVGGKVNKSLILVGKLVPAITSPFWLGHAIIGMVGIFMFTMAVYVPAKNYFEGKNILYVNKDSLIGKLAIKYLGSRAGIILYGGQLLISLILLIL